MKQSKSNSKSFLSVAVIAVVGVFGIGAYLVISNSQEVSAPQSSQTTNISPDANAETVGADLNSETYKMYAELTGESYDRTFIANMIEHHKGAVDMAEVAKTNASRQEIKDMADDIINAQTTEISNMEKWQKDWGYPASSGEAMMDHSAMGMMVEMDTMTESLRNLKGDAFDEMFVEQMILHHQSALDMATPGQSNALHQEVKQLTLAIVNAQSKEIAQMKQWQEAWGFNS